ncbi:Putative DNA methylase, N-6 adenine-specific, S-adenosyl-L-methionine-dependent methyltransferase [Septoria linicola]|uniref:Protein-lysine N-methyltransferase EFM5 n=1 Tax=Septoria linicola TaxID=215465 RepID=A0A9Q9EQW3_9PEZI|nr:putative DNA methylase, N-6 adenine-specific, S-adenosyl-L-methionine-dependent methyltransferase [Septoria linicola]USW59234.1 Putative DNA methylase, N-6 adenine-specific, S-adenosyl-L-methionine-dependent methyltransferase [Septoria linicola]
MDDDDILQLPADTLAALAEFQSERDAKVKEFENLKTKAENDFENGSGKLSMDLFGEDWNASQFWYTDDTARLLAQQLLKDATDESAIAVVSAPSVYVALRNILAENQSTIKPTLCLLEYDRRFEVVGADFEFYDFQQPLRLSSSLKGKFDRIICDPPFLSEDCQTKTALTARYLAKAWETQAEQDLRFISCTGERMESHIVRIYAKIGVKTTTFEPEHSKGLGNEFRCYSNFECDSWRWRSS